MLKKIALSAVASLAVTAPSLADDSAMSQAFAQARLAAFGSGDIDAMVAQYTDDATVFTPQGVLHGKEQIRAMLQAVVAEFSQPGVVFNLTSMETAGPNVAFVWNAETNQNSYSLGVETYVLAEGKAVYQTLVLSAVAK